MSLARPTIAHTTDVYWHLSENWIRTQVLESRRTEPVLLVFRTKNLEGEERVPPVYALHEEPRSRVLANRAARLVLGYYPYFLAAARRHRTRLIHAHYGYNGYYARGLARRLDVPLIASFYGHDLSQLPRSMPVWRRRYLRLWRAGALFLVEGTASREQLLRLGCPPEKARVHHLGIPLARYPWRARALAPDEPLRLLTVGRFSEKKGIPDAVRAVARLVRAGERVQLTVIGDSNGSPEGEREKGRIFEAIGVERVQAHVRLLGMQPRALVDRAYYGHHVLIAASFEASDGENEGGFPVTLTEAAASGMPIIATRHCDIPEIVQDGRTGFLAPERDVAQLARHVQTFRDDPGLLEGMGRAGHEHATASYDARAQADALDALYAELIG